MKKLLSVILAVSLMMSLFCMVPASAEMINTWPYYFEDFEDGANSMQSAVAATIVEGGADGSQYAGQYTVPATSAGRDLKIIAGSTNLVIRTGDTFKATADIKLSKAITPSAGQFYLHYTAANNSPNFTANGFLNVGGGYPAWRFDNTSTDWQKVSFEKVYTGLDVCLDGSMGVTFKVPGDTTGGEYSITLDNVEIQVIKDTAMDSAPTTRVIYENDFSSAMTGITYTGTTASGSGLSLVTPADAETNGTGQVLQMTDANTAGHVKFDINIGDTLDYNKYYLITYKARTVEAYDNSTGTPVAFGTNPGSKHRWTLTGNYFWELNAMKNDNAWQDCALVLHMTNEEGGTFDDGVITMQWWIKYQGSGSDTGIYQFDDIVVREVGGIYNGNFDDVKTFTNGYYKEVNNSNVNNGGAYAPTFAANWTSTNGHITVQNGSYHTAPSMGTMYFKSIDGTAQHTKAAYLTAGERYKFSGWLRPCAMNSAGTLEIGVNYTYTDETAANSVVLTTAATSSSKSTVYKEYTAEFTAPANMATAELYVKHIDTVGEDQNIDRLSTSSANLAYYTDDWGFEKLPSANIPVVTASATTSGDGIVAVAKSFTAPAGVTDASVIKLTATKNGVKSYIASTKGAAITVPESYWTGYTLAAEITPIGSNGYIGKVVTIEVPAVPVVVETTFTATAADGATLTAAEATEGLVIWVAYDVNGKMLDWSSAPMSVTAGGTQTVAVPLDFDATGAAEVKVMLWADMVACKPLADHVAY